MRRAAACGHIAMIHTLIASGAELHWSSKTGNNALHDAAWNGRADAVEALVAAGDANLYYVRTDQIWAPGGDSPTAAGLHPTDEGMHRQASFCAAFLRPLLMSLLGGP